MNEPTEIITLPCGLEAKIHLGTRHSRYPQRTAEQRIKAGAQRSKSQRESRYPYAYNDPYTA